MKKSFMTRALAMGLSFAMAFSLSAATNVTTASAAAKKASVTSMMKVSSKTVTEGKKVTTYMNSTAAKKYRIKSHTESSVTKKYISVKMTDSRKGLTITAKEGALAAANLEKKGVYVKINFAPAKSVAAVKKAAATKYVKLKVAVVAKEKEEEPEKPVVDTFEMTSLTATSANELTAVFASPVASTSAITIKVNKVGSTTAITGTTKWSDDATSVVFTATANLTAGTYEMTATDAADATKTTSKTAVVEAEKVADIVILGDTALTSKDKKSAYVYYDVLNQYGESIRTSASINWTVSSGNDPKIDKAAGKITATKSDSTEFTYGSYLYVTGVYNKTGVTVQKQLTIGMEQSLDTVKTAGFVKLTDKNTILEKLPANFQKGQYLLAFEALDQNENPMDVSGIKAGTDVTFISDNVLLITNDFNAPAAFTTLTIDGKEYGVVTVEPGQYVDKGGEVNITAISNKTGKKTVMNYVIGGTPILKSVVLSQPAEVVADGETVTIPYTAYDTEGNSITNYESIARTTNSINLTAGEGTLTLKENNDGTAKFEWSDRTVSWNDGVTKDEIDRSVALATVVVGGESNNMILSVSDKARPAAVKSVTLRKDATTAIVAQDSETLSISDFTFVDQYGRTMANDNGFFDVACDGWNNEYYAVKATFNKASSNFTLGSPVTEGAILLATGTAIDNAAGTSVTWDAADVPEVKNETVKYSVVSNKNDAADVTDFDNVGKELSVSYSVVPMEKVTSISIDTTKKQYINLGLGEYKTAAEAGKNAANLVSTLGALGITPIAETGHDQKITLSGSYNGVKVVIPSDYVDFTANKFDFAGTDTITAGAVVSGSMKLGDFYDATAANFARKDGTDTITARVFKVTTGAVDLASDASIKANQHAAPTTTLTFSDAMPAPAQVELCGEACTANPTDTDLINDVLIKHGKKHAVPSVLDQYGIPLTSGITWSYNISDVTENAGEFAHLDKSFVVNANDTNSTSITGAELGDKYTLTLTASNGYGSAKGSIKMTVGSDKLSYISDKVDSDKTFRKRTLNYAY